MSAIAGLFFFDRRPVSQGIASWLSATIAEHGPDRGGEYVGPGIVMVHRALVVTPEDVAERQPLRSSQGHMVTWDGRLDNREEIALWLGRAVGHRGTDAEIVGAAFDRSSRGAFGRLVGDWSLAIWDITDDALVLASDYMGVRPLYYVVCRDYVAWSTCLSTVVLLSGEYDNVSEEYIAGYLIGRPAPEVTPYVRIMSVPAGANIRTRRTRHKSTEHHWTMTAARTEYARPHQYAERLVELMGMAVRSRVRAAGPVWAELSGGVDSSVIVCTASRCLAEHRTAGVPLHTASHVNLDVPDSPELPLMNAVEQAVDCSPHHVPSSDQVPERALDWVSPDGIPPARLATYQLMRDMGARVILAGDIANDALGSYRDWSMAVFDDLRHWQIREALAHAKTWSRVLRMPVWRLVARASAGFALIQRLERRGVWPQSERVMATGRDWHIKFNALTPRMVDIVTAQEEAFRRSLPTDVDPVKRVMVYRLNEYIRRRALAARERHNDVRPTYPFSDRRLVEFTLSIPGKILGEPGRPRGFTFAAFGALLPDLVVKQVDRGPRPGPQARKYRGDALQALRDGPLLVVERGFIEPEALKRRIDELRFGQGVMGNLRRLEYLECWLRRRSDSGARDSRTSNVPDLVASHARVASVSGRPSQETRVADT